LGGLQFRNLTDRRQRIIPDIVVLRKSYLILKPIGRTETIRVLLRKMLLVLWFVIHVELLSTHRFVVLFYLLLSLESGVVWGGAGGTSDFWLVGGAPIPIRILLTYCVCVHGGSLVHLIFLLLRVLTVT
jgi:hypothetical protein